MIVHDAAVAFVAVIRAAIAWAGVIGGALGFVACVVAFSVGPLIAPRARGRGQEPAGASRRPSCGSRDAGGAPEASGARLRPPPSWAHAEPTEPTERYEEAA